MSPGVRLRLFRSRSQQRCLCVSPLICEATHSFFGPQLLLCDARMPRDECTNYSRFLRRNLAAGEVELFQMNCRNIRVEGDGLGYPEMTLFRAIFLEQILTAVMGTSRWCTTIHRGDLESTCEPLCNTSLEGVSRKFVRHKAF